MSVKQKSKNLKTYSVGQAFEQKGRAKLRKTCEANYLSKLYFPLTWSILPLVHLVGKGVDIQNMYLYLLIYTERNSENV